ncbi:MAG TPA: helix-turn-helix domain-containing protein [Phenylobacterium sp.]|nr:helix-turn-helix domain-containing protein [Phenylobacterium sp.]
MTVETSAGARAPRRSQAERSASMRARLIDAAIVCLDRLGYSATTLSTIAEEAGVSRGGMLHQFPSKVDLMLAVVAYASGADERAQPALSPDAFPDHRAYFMSLTDVVWQAQKTPAVMAKLEIMVAARSDKVLAEKLPAIFNDIEHTRCERMWERAQELGIRDKAAIVSMVSLHMAAMRGLSIELLLTDDPAQVERSYALLKHYKDLLIDELIAAAAETA